MIQLLALLLKLIPGINRAVEAFAKWRQTRVADERLEQKNRDVDAAIDAVRMPVPDGQRKEADGAP